MEGEGNKLNALLHLTVPAESFPSDCRCWLVGIRSSVGVLAPFVAVSLSGLKEASMVSVGHPTLHLPTSCRYVDFVTGWKVANLSAGECLQCTWKLCPPRHKKI